jgi:hypothetical protein
VLPLRSRSHERRPRGVKWALADDAHAMVALLTKVRDSPLLGSPLGRQRTKSAVVGLVVLGGVIAVDELVIRAVSDTSYLELYLTYGALANLVIVVFTLAWSDKLERHASLISAHPMEYLGGSVDLGSALGEAFSAAVSPGRAQYRALLDAQARARDELGWTPRHTWLKGNSPIS